MVYLDARLVSGTDVLFEMTDFERRAQAADVLVTGEGALDATSLQGKIPGRVAAIGSKLGKPCFGICGIIDPGIRSHLEATGFEEILEIAPPEIPVDQRKLEASRWIFQTGVLLANRFSAL